MIIAHDTRVIYYTAHTPKYGHVEKNSVILWLISRGDEVFSVERNTMDVSRFTTYVTNTPRERSTLELL